MNALYLIVEHTRYLEIEEKAKYAIQKQTWMFLDNFLTRFAFFLSPV